MATPTPTPLALASTWERPIVNADGDETALVVTISAPQRPIEAAATRTPIDVAFVLDRSGSMAGEKLHLVKDAVDVALDHLSAHDRVALVIFDDSVDTLHTLAPATAEVKATIRRRLARVEAGGSTYLSGGWLAGCRELANAEVAGTDQVRPRRAILLTDGRANIGITDNGELAKHATELRLRGITTTTIGVGLGFDEMLLSAMAEAGGGAFQFIAHPRELSPFFAGEIADLQAVAATRPVLRLTLPHGVRAALINAFPAHREGKTITVELRDLSAGETLRLVFAVEVAAGELGSTVAPSLMLSWTDDVGRHRFVQPVPTLTLATPEVVASTPNDDEARATVVLERAAKAQREAINLDRQGRYEESRRLFAANRDMLMHAPQTADIMQEALRHGELAAAPMAPLSEEARKERVFSAARRSRGHREHPTE
ncbi:MAG: VWA domain-containing protein [Thermomicrobiales bacterium]